MSFFHFWTVKREERVGTYGADKNNKNMNISNYLTHRQNLVIQQE